MTYYVAYVYGLIYLYAYRALLKATEWTPVGIIAITIITFIAI